MRTRRDFLAQIITAAGAAATPLTAAVAEIFNESTTRDHFKVLTPEATAFLTQLADIIIPATDTAAASEVGVVKFIDGMLADWYDADESREYVQGLELCRSEAGRVPSAEYVSKLDAAAFAAAKPSDPRHQFYRTSKELVIVGYFTSKQGMQDTLHMHGPIGQYSFGPSGPPGNDIRY
jgi:hypothetical protein